MRAPAVIRWKGVIKPATIYSDIFASLDLAADARQHLDQVTEQIRKWNVTSEPIAWMLVGDAGGPLGHPCIGSTVERQLKRIPSVLV